jgi:hypothetical protein
MKEKKKGVCHDCLDLFNYSQLYSINIVSQAGPEHLIGLCKECTKSRGFLPTDLKTIQEIAK